MHKEKTNVRGGIDALEIGGKFTLPKGERKVSYVRNAASTIAGDTGKKFSVSAVDNMIVVTRKA